MSENNTIENNDNNDNNDNVDIENVEVEKVEESISNSTSYQIADLPKIIEDLKKDGLKLDTLYDVFNIVSNISSQLFSAGAALEGELEKDFNNRVAPLIVELLVTFDFITRDGADTAKKYILSSLNVGVDAVEEIINIDIDGDGKVGFSAGDDHQSLLHRINDKLEELIKIDINRDGHVGSNASSEKSSGKNRKCILI